MIKTKINKNHPLPTLGDNLSHAVFIA